MHASIDELLSLRDGEPLAAVTQVHIEDCQVCAARLRELMQRQQSLRELPQPAVPAIDFSSIQSRAATLQQTRLQTRYRWAAAAAIVVCASIGFATFERDPVEPTFVRSLSPPPADVGLLPVAKLVAQSRELDELLQRLPAPRQVQRVSSAATLDRIEQRVQWIDSQLSSIPDRAMAQARGDEVEQRLWQERVNLMDSLVKVRYVESLPQAF